MELLVVVVVVVMAATREAEGTLEARETSARRTRRRTRQRARVRAIDAGSASERRTHARTHTTRQSNVHGTPTSTKKQPNVGGNEVPVAKSERGLGSIDRGEMDGWRVEEERKRQRAGERETLRTSSDSATPSSGMPLTLSFSLLLSIHRRNTDPDGTTRLDTDRSHYCTIERAIRWSEEREREREKAMGAWSEPYRAPSCWLLCLSVLSLPLRALSSTSTHSVCVCSLALSLRALR